MDYLSIQQIKLKSNKIPFIKRLKEKRYEKRFITSEYFGCFRGVYKTFEEARKSAPPYSKTDFNLQEFSTQYLDRIHHVFQYDYPILFWMKQVIQKNSIIFDLGGNIGVHYYSYEHYLNYSDSIKWIVCDMPEVIKAGQVYAQEQNRNTIHFCSSIDYAEGADILLSSGTLQYIESPSLSESLSKLKKMPKHILISKIPLFDGKSFVTIQNASASFVPQYVFNKKHFIDSLASLGYELIDIWNDPSRKCIIPLHPEHSGNFFYGLYLRLRN